MAKQRRVISEKVNGVNIINPNNGDINTPIENLSIFADLYALRRTRSIIKVSEDDDLVNIGRMVVNDTPFNEGVNTGEGLKLTTNYTELGGNSDYNGSETLGITNIDIDFNSAYMPMIKIDLVDVRARMLEMGEKSPYNAFYDFPYPIFKLVVKGFYGKPVEYTLHLTDFNIKFESETGNAIINCEFVGYTYAYLSDMLIGILKGIPYTTEGKEIINRKRLEGDFVSFDELYEYAKILNKDITNIKENDEDVKQLVLLQKTMSDVNSLRDSLGRTVSNKDAYDVVKQTGTLLFINPSDISIRNLKADLANIKLKVESINSVKKLFNTDNFELNSDNFYQGLSRNSFIDEDGNIIDNAEMLELLGSQDLYNKMSSAFKTTPKIGTNVTVFNFGIIISEINKVYTTLRDRFKELEKTVANKVFDDIEKLEITDINGDKKYFDFNIKNYVKVLCDHVDILIESIKKVSESAENNQSRNQVLSNYLSNMDVMGDITNVYAFPEYSKEINGEFNEVWIGEDIDDIHEVRFIKELYNGIINSANNEESFINYVDSYNTQWFTVNPFDTLIYRNNSPYSIFNVDSNISHNEILRLILIRFFVFIGTTVKNPTRSELKSMAQLEAHNLFENINSETLINTLTSLGNDQDIIDYVYNLAVRGQNSLTIENNSDSNGIIMTNDFEIDENIISSADIIRYYKYIYVDEYGHKLLPLNVDDYSGDTWKSKTWENRTDDVVFSDYGSNDNLTHTSNGATYIDFISRNEYDLNIESNPDYTNDIIMGNNINNSTNLSESFLNSGDYKNMLFNGRFNTNEFINYELNGDIIDFKYYFLDKQDNGNNDLPMFSTGRVNSTKFDLGSTEILNRDFTQITNNHKNRGNTVPILNNDNRHIPFIGFSVDDIEPLSLNWVDYSLFGSEYYYNQTLDGKSLLFLHSLPFKGLTNNEGLLIEDIRNVFSQKAGFVDVPYSWVALIGGLLKRNVNEFLIFENNNKILFPISGDDFTIPNKDQYLKVPNVDSPHSYGDDYLNIEDTILNLPNEVKTKFIEIFDEFTNNEFTKIKNKLEIFPDNTSFEDRLNHWLYYYDQSTINNLINSENYIIILPDARQFRYSNGSALFGPNRTQIDDRLSYLNDTIVGDNSGTPNNLFLEMSEGTEVINDLFKFLDKSLILVNGTYKIWENNSYDGFIALRSDVEAYITTFFRELKNKKDNSVNTNQDVFGKTNMDDIYLMLYKNIKSIKDKWVNDTVLTNLINTFTFIDRGYNDIGEQFKLNPLMVSDLLTSNYNQSLYSHISRVLNENNFDFIATPTYINYSNIDSLESIFRTHDFNSAAISEPNFMCIYIGERSKTLENNRRYPSDSFNIDSSGRDIPNDMNDVPAILVRYGDESQNIFTGIDLNQKEFSETNESLKVTDAIATSYNNINSLGQNLYKVYTNRAYNCGVKSLGNLMIQPFMYFQLNNIPIFRGAYIITRVQHNITPGMVTTHFNGNRVKRNKTKLMDKITVFNSILGQLDKINVNNVNLNVIDTGDGSEIDVSSNEATEYPRLTVSTMGNEIYDLGYNSVNVNNDHFNNLSNTQKNGEYMLLSEIFTEVSQMTGIDETVLKTIAYIESRVGQYSTVKSGIPNPSGFVGINQFGLNSTRDIKKLVEDHIQNHSNYEYGATFDYVTNSIIIPQTWDSNKNNNNKDTNSMFDDYLNILACAELAKLNKKYFYSAYKHNLDLRNSVDIYLSHQQGVGGLNNIKSNPNEPINSNAYNNLYESLKDRIQYNNEFYLYYGGKVEKIVKSLDSNHPLFIGTV